MGENPIINGTPVRQKECVIERGLVGKQPPSIYTIGEPYRSTSEYNILLGFILFSFRLTSLMCVKRKA